MYGRCDDTLLHAFFFLSFYRHVKRLSSPPTVVPDGILFEKKRKKKETRRPWNRGFCQIETHLWKMACNPSIVRASYGFCMTSWRMMMRRMIMYSHYWYESVVTKQATKKKNVLTEENKKNTFTVAPGRKETVRLIFRAAVRHPVSHATKQCHARNFI